MKIINGGKNKKKAKAKKPRKNKSRYDWEAIAVDVRGRSLTLRAISRKHKIDYGYMMRGCKKRGIKRDLADQVQKEVKNQLIIRRAKTVKKVTTKKSPPKKVTTGKPEDPTDEKELTDKEIVDLAAFAELEFIDDWHKTLRSSLKIVTILKAHILADDSKDIVVGDKLIAVGYSPKERAAMLNAITQGEQRIFEMMRKNYGITTDQGGQEAPALIMDYGTGKADAELAKRKT